MMTRRLRLQLIAGLTLAGLLAAGAPAGQNASAMTDSAREPEAEVATQSTRAPAVLRYVALGDSYSAASGVAPPDPRADPRCLRSLGNYPKLLAESMRRFGRDVRLRDVTCGAADTDDFFSSQYDGIAAQLDALGRRTRLVTMTIGGNNEGVFVGAIEACGTAAATTAGRGNPCQRTYGDSFVRTIRKKTRPALVRALRAVHRRAPRAQIVVLGYPWIMPREKGCYPQMPVAEGDVPYLRTIQRVLNRVVRRSAERTGSTYVDFARASDGRDACQTPQVRWIEPAVGATHPVVVHPNARGERRMAQRTRRVLRTAGLTDRQYAR